MKPIRALGAQNRLTWARFKCWWKTGHRERIQWGGRRPMGWRCTNCQRVYVLRWILPPG